jgi:hypothetical protein
MELQKKFGTLRLPEDSGFLKFPAHQTSAIRQAKTKEHQAHLICGR